MERYCSYIGQGVKNRRDPYANINRRVRDAAQLQMIRHLYDMRDIITFQQTRASTDADEIDNGEADQLPDCELFT